MRDKKDDWTSFLGGGVSLVRPRGARINIHASAALKKIRRLADKGRRGGDPLGPAESVGVALMGASLRAYAMPSEHLGRVAMTLGVLRTTRGSLRALNQEKAEWQVGEGAVAAIDEAASRLAAEAQDMIRANYTDEMPEEVFRAFFKKRSAFPKLRRDLRFAEYDGSRLVPFGPDFPELDFNDLDHGMLMKIGDDVGAILTSGLPLVAEAEDEAARKDVSMQNWLTLASMHTAIGKCAMSSWAPEHGAFLEALACLVVDRDFDRPD